MITDFSDVFNSQCPNECFSVFIDKYKNGFDKCFPKLVTTYKQNRKSEPWYTQELKTVSQHKCKLYKTKLLNPTEANIDNYKVELKTYNGLRKKLKENYCKNKLNVYKYNMKKLWSFINETIGKTKEKPKL